MNRHNAFLPRQSVADTDPACLRAFTHRQAQSSRRFMNSAGWQDEKTEHVYDDHYLR